MADIHEFCPLWGSWMPETKLGEGSFGTVWKMRREELGKTYYSAVKHLSVPKDTAEIQRLIEEEVFTGEDSAHRYYDVVRDQLLDEINTMYQLRGFTNIVSYEDHLLIPKKSGIGYDIFLRMELLQGLPAKAKKGMTTEDVVKLGQDIATAIDVLNRHGLVHRDIKPQNIFLNDIGDYKLGDYGTARALESNATAMSRKGTYNYMAPEIYNNDQADWSVDVYSLGVVLYRYMNGNRLPFLPLTGDITNQMNEEALLKRIKGKDVIPAPAYADAVLSSIILKACAFDPKDRYPNGKAMKDALAAYKPEKNVVSSLDQEETVEDSHQFIFDITSKSDKDKSNRTTGNKETGDRKISNQISVSIKSEKESKLEKEKTIAEEEHPAQPKSDLKSEPSNVDTQKKPADTDGQDSYSKEKKKNKRFPILIGSVSAVALILALAFMMPKPSYTVVWKNEDGSILETDLNVSKGAVPEYDGATPSKEDSENRVYKFDGWTPTLKAVSENAIYTAVFSSFENKKEPTTTTAALPENGWTCEACGSTNQKDSIFCEICGHSKDDWICEKCGNANAAEAVFCEKCGYRHGKWVCGVCGFENLPEAEFCEECGQKGGSWKCESCGFINLSDSIFCEECGTKEPDALLR